MDGSPFDDRDAPATNRSQDTTRMREIRGYTLASRNSGPALRPLAQGATARAAARPPWRSDMPIRHLRSTTARLALCAWLASGASLLPVCGFAAAHCNGTAVGFVPSTALGTSTYHCL